MLPNGMRSGDPGGRCELSAYRFGAELTDAGGELAIVLPVGAARRVFEITTLDRVLPVAASLKDAVEKLA